MGKHIITISRSYGSGGRQVAKAISRELGIHYYDKELMTMVSMEHGINMSIVSGADEKHEESRFSSHRRKMRSLRPSGSSRRGKSLHPCRRGRPDRECHQV